MTAWWYAEKDQKTGPVDKDELKRLLQAGKIGPKTMLWHERMEAWWPLDEVDELNELNASMPPPLPLETGPDPLSYPLATRWPRFFARVFDVWWETLLVAIILGAVLGYYSASFVKWINGPFASLFGLLCLPIALVLDALLYRASGNTPGKALLGLKVGTLNGKPLSLAQYVNRNFSIWVSGLALGLPFINLFTMANQSFRLGRGQQASYDEPTGFRVRSRPIGWVHKMAFGLAFSGLLIVIAVLNRMEQTAQRNAISDAAQEYYSWENPLTRINAKVDSTWKHSVLPTDDGQQVYMFSEPADRAAVILGVEQAPGYSMDDYVRLLKKSNAANMRFSDGGRFFERDGRHAWQGAGMMMDSTNNRLDVQIIRVDSSFWRVVTIQTMPHDYSDALVEQLRTALWSTVE